MSNGCAARVIGGFGLDARGERKPRAVVFVPGARSAFRLNPTN
jgi:hypothetical protein